MSDKEDLSLIDAALNKGDKMAYSRLMQKYRDFLMSFSRLENRGKLVQDAARRRPPFPGCSGPRERPETRYKKQETRPKGLKAIGKEESWPFRKKKKAILRDLTRPKAKGLANFSSVIKFKCFQRLF